MVCSGVLSNANKKSQPQESQNRQKISNSSSYRSGGWGNHHVLPTWAYDISETFRHRDALGREWQGVVDDRYLSYWDGRPNILTVQSADDGVYERPADTTYRRTHIRNISPWMLRLAFWAMEGKGTSSDWFIFGKCLAAALPMTILVSAYRYPLIVLERLTSHCSYLSSPTSQVKAMAATTMSSRTDTTATPRHLAMFSRRGQA